MFRTSLLAACAVASLTVQSSAFGQTDTTTTDPIILASKQAQARYEAETAASNAQTAAINAKAATSTAGMANFPTSGLTGLVTADASAGSTEVYMVAAQAANAAALEIRGALPSSCNAVLVAMSADNIQLGRYRMYELQRTMLKKAFANADLAFQAARTTDRKGTVASQNYDEKFEIKGVGNDLLPAAVGIDAFAKLGSFFQSDYNIKGISITGDDVLLREAVVSRMAGTPAKSNVVAVPAVPAFELGRVPFQAPFTQFQTDLLALDKSAREAAANFDAADARAKVLREAQKSEKDPVKAKPIGDLALTFELAASLLKGSTDSYKALITQLSTVDAATGQPGAAGVLQDMAVSYQLFNDPVLPGTPTRYAGSCVLIVKTHSIGGNAYTKKNLWTFFGSMPFYIGGATVVSYTYLDPANNFVLAAGTVERHGGYGKIHDVAKAFGAPTYSSK